MQTDDIQNEEEELLSETCRRLAARLADLIDRTMNLYERDLAIAEAHPPCRSGALAGQKPENKKCRADAPVGQTSEKVENPPRNYATRTTRTSCLNSIKSLVQTMEGLLRCAKLARELEQHDQQWGEQELTREEIAELMGETDNETYPDNRNIDNPPSHTTYPGSENDPDKTHTDYQTFSAPHQRPP